MVTRYLFLGFVVLLALQRCAELVKSRRNEATMRKRGGVEHASWQTPWLMGLHTAWFVTVVVEVFCFRRPFIPVLAAAL